MKNILLIGAFGYKINKLDGQTVKTRNIYQMLKQRTNYEISFFDTLDVKYNLFLLFKLFVMIVKCDIVIIIPCSNSLNKIYVPLYHLSKIFKFEIIFIGVGGWQIEYFMGGYKFKPHPKQFEISKKIKAFLPEIKSVTEELVTKYGFKNCETFPNFRLGCDVDSFSGVLTENLGQLKLVFIGRINKNKGYDIIFNMIPLIRAMHYDMKIDFYGPLNSNDQDDFLSKICKNKDFVEYKGELAPNEIVSILKKYDVMLFPTQYYTEGVPGSIIDAYMSEIPVVATCWKHAHEVVIDNVSGIIVPFDNCQEFFNNAVLKLYKDRKYLLRLKQGTIQGLIPYSEKTAWSILRKYIE